MQIFEVNEGKIAVFSVSDEQIDPQTEAIEPIDVKILAITREIRDHQEFAAARTVADTFHLRKVAQEVLAVLFGKVFGLATHAAENLDTGNHVIAVEPVGKRVLTTTKQNRTGTLFVKNAV